MLGSLGMCALCDFHSPTQWVIQHFGKPAMYVGEGGSIPFMHMLGEKFPKAQFCVAGVLGPGSNAHGPSEFLHIPTAKKLTLCVADVLATHATHG